MLAHYLDPDIDSIAFVYGITQVFVMHIWDLGMISRRTIRFFPLQIDFEADYDLVAAIHL